MHLPKGAPVTQNNVARESGREPSALKKKRYPELVLEIQRWVDEHALETPPSKNAAVDSARRRNRVLVEGKQIMQVQFDAMAAELLAARSMVLESRQTIERLEAQLGMDKVVPLKRRKTHERA
jgi:hypothetical protein